MSRVLSRLHPVAERRAARGWAQNELAERAGIPRSSVSAIEAGRLTPSVTAALAVAQALECSVEELFRTARDHSRQTSSWAWEPRSSEARFWEAEVGGQRRLYPVESLSGHACLHDGISRAGVLHEHSAREASQTLVMAGCDPAAGLLAAEYEGASGFRLLCFSRGGGAALELLKQGMVHVAALHRSTAEHPGRNAASVLEKMGTGYRLLRSAEWQAGIVLPTGDRSSGVAACARRVRRWALRERGSAARECLDQLLGRSPTSRHVLPSHQAVADAVRHGWAEAGVCVQLCADEAGLRFLPVQRESLDLCFAASMEHDPRIQALIRLLRSRSHRRMIDELPGYHASETGAMVSV